MTLEEFGAWIQHAKRISSPATAIVPISLTPRMWSIVLSTAAEQGWTPGEVISAALSDGDDICNQASEFGPFRTTDEPEATAQSLGCPAGEIGDELEELCREYNLDRELVVASAVGTAVESAKTDDQVLMGIIQECRKKPTAEADKAQLPKEGSAP